MKTEKEKDIRPKQHQDRQPGLETLMKPAPEYEPAARKLKLEGKVALITGGDSGIGRAVALAFAQEGANVLISYLNEHQDAHTTIAAIASMGRKGIAVSGDIADEKHCKKLVNQTIKAFGQLDVLVNNAAVQYPQDGLEKITAAQLEKTFRSNVFPHFYLSKAALKYLKEGSSIISTTSVTAYRGSDHLIDYAATKSAIAGFIRSLSASLAPRKIRVNGVAPGPIWTPLIPATFPPAQVATFGSDVPLKRAGEPNEVAPCYVFLASDDASYMTGQVLHPNGGEIING
ncbi:NAD(P)-dependent dehydrogenase, short-chain alcohol dehydrogenase family [Pedobacter steynii]|uniref:NAD(P)-dependent dehydrogenase, short-chain alcohol dehydrogenase family n=1 Tax=Pedobacter steynii TaxID=430522 RepID=A0A1H0CAB2_9SPHI|nr:SDR family oxidoreductase [Pedobacter steynii]NQX41512.1 SDR family oxidoreductase [Pedobacter steynii]SDN54864.1 NAD(P)-dependent dehydrogenase, short-chain alcohol dehydrogenase family [Pedobacter steynii]